MTPIYLVLLTVVLYSAAAIIRKQISAVDDDLNYIYSVLFQLAGGVAVFILSLLLGFGAEYQAFLPALDLYTVIKIAVGSALWFLATITSFKALNSISASKYSIIETLSPVVTIILALLFLGERLNGLQPVGMVLIFLSVVVVVYDKNDKITHFSKGELIGLLSAALSGVALANDKGIYAITPLAPTLTALFILPGIMGILARPRELKKLPIVSKNKRVIQQLLLMSIIWGVAATSYYKAIVLSNSVSLVVSLGQLSVVLTVLLGLIFLKETKNWQIKIAASLASLVGLILMSV